MTMAKHDKDPSLEKPVKSRFPGIVLVIILAEFCERFSYSGMRAFLTLYLRSKLGYTDEGATETYHIFSTLVYIFPIFGGILADNYLGKFRTILYMMFVYAAGNLLVAVTAIPGIGLPPRLCTLLGLFLITSGTGGIKPCVTSFGGDQFKLPEQERHLATYFSILYFVLCFGSLVAKTISPILRSEVHCFGDKDCYSLAFGAPGFIVLASIVIFVSAKSRYVMKKPEGNIIIDFVKCVALGIKNVLTRKNRRQIQSHWLDSTTHKFDQRFIKDVKKTLSILKLFSLIPAWWALLDQQGSRWTLQAAKMDGRFGWLTIKPEQMQVLAPIIILIFIPLCQKVIYPWFERRSMLTNPLHKIIIGGVLIGVAFIASGVVDIYLKTTYPLLPKPGYSQLRIFNGYPCPLTITKDNISQTIPSLSPYINRDITVRNTRKFILQLEGSCLEPREEYFMLQESMAISYFVTNNGVNRYEDNVDKSKAGFPVVRFLVTRNALSSNLTLYNERREEVEAEINKKLEQRLEIFTSTYSLKADGEVFKAGLEFESGGVYTVIIDKKNGTYYAEVIVITGANSVTMALLLPQFILMGIGEVFFGMTGNEFAFKEAPKSMKAVMTAVWLMTEAGGNVIIIIVTRLFGSLQQETQTFMYTGLILVAVTVFHFLSRGYRFGQEDPQKTRSNSEVLYLQVKQAEDCLDH